MRRKILAIILALFLLGVGFGIGILAGWGMLSPRITPPESAIIKLLWETRDELKARYYRPEDLTDEKLLYGAIRGLVEAAGDPYTTFFSPSEARQFLEDVSGHFEGIGAEIGFRDHVLRIIAPIPHSPAEAVGLRAGDAILAIDGASTERMTLEEAVSRIRGPSGTSVTLRIVREGEEEPKEYVIRRQRIELPTVEIDRRFGDIAVVRLFNFTEDAPKRFRELASALAENPPRGIILDLRNNAGGFLDAAVDIAGWFLPPQTPVVIERQRNEPDLVRRTEGPGTFASIPLVILVNEGTASAAEILAGALNEERKDVPLVGERTFGKGTIQEFPPLSGGAALKVTIGEWLTPKGISIEQRGLTPTVSVSDDPHTDTDEILEHGASLIP
jgi:carboxyl-terminal processing protease